MTWTCWAGSRATCRAWARSRPGPCSAGTASTGGGRFGILYGGKFYLKVDAESEGDFLARGMGPFRPNERQTLKSYYEVPPDVLADPEALRLWAGEAIRAGMASR